ncbi:hypothetical protein KJ840_05310 [Patescibacteria group bacterium]|nr:hypothetical protein [Patescibacteria group bacterium]
MDFDETLGDQRLFLIFSMALLMVFKSTQILKDGGANPQAIELICEGIELISLQLDEAAERLEKEKKAQKWLEKFKKDLHIPPAIEPPD